MGTTKSSASSRYRRERMLLPAAPAYRAIHFPESLEAAAAAHHRFVYEDFFLLELGLALRRRRQGVRPGLSMAPPGALVARLRASLPFRLTSAQERVWDEIRQDLWSHLQIEDGLVSWGEAHHAIPGALLDTLKNERQEMRKLIATLRDLSSGMDRELTAGGRSAFTRTLLALARTIDSHVERYDGGVLPSILRAPFPKGYVLPDGDWSLLDPVKARAGTLRRAP